MKKVTNKKGLIISLCVTAVAILTVAAVIVLSFADMKMSESFDIAKAQQVVDQTFGELPNSVAKGAKDVFEKTEIKVEKVELGQEKNAKLYCTYKTVDVLGAVTENKDDIILAAYESYLLGKDSGKVLNATYIRQQIADKLSQYINSAKEVNGTVELDVYQTGEDEFKIHLSDEVVNLCFGDVLKVDEVVDTMTSVRYGGKVVDLKNRVTIRTGIKDSFKLINYDSKKPEVGNFVVKWCNEFAYDFHRNFIEKDRWIYLAKGLGTTLSITALAGIMGMILGFVVAIIRCTNEITGKLKAIDKVCRVYLTVIRGTPVMVQLLIIYFVLLLPIGVPKFISAVLCFGLNSGAYVAEIVRGGIMSIDKGQTEAGRSLGFGYAQTMVHFIVPQAFKAVLPSLANEFITLLKESSVAFYIGVADLTQGGLKIRSLTYSNFMPLIAVAIVYLVIVLILTKLVGILERRLRKSDH